jgi:hypothetical protein
MATQADVRRIARELPGTMEGTERFAFFIDVKGKEKGYAWVWMERVDPRKARSPNPGVLAVRVRNLGQKDALIAAEPRKFFTEPHYNGFPAVLVRLKEARAADLRLLLRDAWESVGGANAAPVRKGAKRRTRSR